MVDIGVDCKFTSITFYTHKVLDTINYLYTKACIFPYEKIFKAIIEGQISSNP